jgi:hypothetical protein
MIEHKPELQLVEVKPEETKSTKEKIIELYAKINVKIDELIKAKKSA